MVTEEEEELVGESKTLSQPFLQIKVFCFVCFLENQNNNAICRIILRYKTVFPSSVGGMKEHGQAGGCLTLNPRADKRVFQVQILRQEVDFLEVNLEMSRPRKKQ